MARRLCPGCDCRSDDKDWARLPGFPRSSKHCRTCVEVATLHSKPCPGCDVASDPASWKPLRWDGATRDVCPLCHADQAQL